MEGGKVIYGPTRQLDYELEVAAIVGKPTAFGDTVSVQEADDHIFGLVLINDWSGKQAFLGQSVYTMLMISNSTRYSGIGDVSTWSNERQKLWNHDESLGYNS